MNLDEHLEPKFRKREKDEIDAALTEDYDRFLRDERIERLFEKLTEKNRQQVREDMIYLLIEQNEYGRKDKEFEKTIDWDEVSWSQI